LLTVATALGGLTLYWLLGPLPGGGRPARGLDVPALSRTPAPGEVVRIGPGGAGDVRSPVRAPGVAGGGLEVDLADAHWVEGRVALPAGTPPDEQVALYVASFGPDQELPGERREEADGSGPRDLEVPCELDATGAFRAPVHPAAARALLRLEARYLFLAAPLELDPAGPAVVVEPELGAWLTGRLVPPEGVAGDDLAGLDVRLRAWSPLGVAVRLVRRTSLAGELSFEFRAVRTDLDHTLMIDPPRLAAVTELSLDLAPGQHLDRTWRLQRGARAEGRVVDSEGAPVPGAVVRADTAGLPHVVRPERRSVADELGGFVLEGISPGSVALYAQRPGYAPASTEAQELRDGETLADVELVLARGDRLAGRVTWPDGSPAPGARVEATEEVRPSLLTGGYDRRDDAAEAGSDGSFAVEGLGDGPFVVRASATPEGPEGSQGGEPAWWAAREGVRPGDDVALVLRAPFAVSGRVVDDRLEAIPRLALQVAELRGPGAGEGTYHEELVRLEDPDGVFHLDGLAAGTWAFTAHAEGHVSKTLVTTIPAERDPLLIVLPRSASLAGTVVDPTGAPVAGAEVDFQPVGEARPWHLRPAVSDENGRFELAGLPPTTTEVYAVHADWAPSERSMAVLAAGALLTGFVIELRPAGRLTGEVYRDGRPAAGREVLVLGDTDEAGGSAVADGRGRFELGGLAAGDYVVTPVRDLDSELSAADLEAAAVTLVAGQTTHVVLGLPPERPVRLRGRVSHSGEGAVGAEVLVFRSGASAMALPAETTSGGGGEFQVELEGPGCHLVVVTPPGGPPSEFPVAVPRVSEVRVDLALPTGSIRGRVLDADGAPLPGARVDCVEEGGPPSLSGLSGRRSAFANETGTYALTALGAGAYTLRAGGGERGLAVRAGVVVDEGADVQVDLTLPHGGTLLGTVLDSDGRPVADASVYLRTSSGVLLDPSGRTRTDAGGHFECAGCPSGDYTVSARAKGSASIESVPIFVPAGGNAAVELVLEPGAFLRVTVEDSTGVVPAAVLVRDTVGREVGAMGSGTEEPTGLYSVVRTLGPLVPGTYAVLAREGDRSAETAVSLRRGETRELTLRFE
jgi:protocatechuate 3,4-dioxygenase beta subunit